MIVCLCAGVNDRSLRKAMREGARSIRELGEATGAGTHCGSCCCDLRRIAAENEPPNAAAGREPRIMVLRR